MDGTVVKVIIDNHEYLFKLSNEEEIGRLQQLATQLERRIQANKINIATTDYTKVLILTCLDLLEEINQSQKVEKPVIDSELFKRLMEIRSSLSQHDHP